MAGKHVALRIFTLLILSASVLGTAYFAGFLKYLPTGFRPAAFGGLTNRGTSPLEDQMTHLAQKCVTQWMTKSQVEIQNLTISSPREVTLSSADKLNGFTYASKFDMRFTVKKPGQQWMDYSGSMMGVIRNKVMMVYPEAPDLVPVSASQVDHEVVLSKAMFYSFLLGYEGMGNVARWDCKLPI